MSPMVVSQSRAIPVPREEAFGRVLQTSLPAILRRRIGPIPPVTAVREAPDSWGTVGQSRRITLAGGGTMLEELTSVEPPTSFGYTLSEMTGLFKPLVSAIDGVWAFEDAGTGCRISWQWTLHPRGVAGRLALPVLARFWHGYARQALEELEHCLLRGPAA